MPNFPYDFPDEIECEVLDKDGNAVGTKKFYNVPNEHLLSNWISRPKPNGEPCVPLTNAITPPQGARKDQRGTKWSDGAVGWLCTSPDIQNTKYVFLLSSGASRGHGIFVNEENLWQCAVLFTAEKIVNPTWLNDRDQFLQPSKELPEEFKNDCLVWMLFNGSNLTASADNLEWNGQKWSIVNHFIPFTETEVGASDRFESDFMVQYMQARRHSEQPSVILSDSEESFSPEAQKVLEEGKKIWQKYFETEFNHEIRDKFKLNRADVGWYQIRQAIKAYNEQGENIPISFDSFESAYNELTEKLRPQVYEYGFLKA